MDFLEERFNLATHDLQWICKPKETTTQKVEQETVPSDEFKPTIRLYALAQRALCVAQTRIEGSWSAYCDSVPGENHQDEAENALRFGDKLPETVARLLFPEFEDLPYAL